jgi:hypothetical protein
MNAVLDEMLEELLGKMEPMIHKDTLHELIVSRVRSELSGQQLMDGTDTLTSDLSLLMNLTWQKRKEEFEKILSKISLND